VITMLILTAVATSADWANLCPRPPLHGAAKYRSGKTRNDAATTGFYVAMPEALGRGLRARSRTTCGEPEARRIDYLRTRARVHQLWYCALRCAWSINGRRHWRRSQADRSYSRFGASDCGCRSHLFFSRLLMPSFKRWL
jgi:Uri superfamily endonuclease